MVEGLGGEFEGYAGGMMEVALGFFSCGQGKMDLSRHATGIMAACEFHRWRVSYGSRYPVQPCILLLSNMARVGQSWAVLVMSRR